MRIASLIAAGMLGAVGMSAQGQEPVTPAADTEALFHSADPQLDANKHVAYMIEKDLLQAEHWELASKYLTERYIQHNPNAASGRAAVVRYFTQVVKVKPGPITPKLLKNNIVAVMADGDLVLVASVHKLKDPKDPTKSYTTTSFDMWRIKDGKADEHWDQATKAQ